MQDWTKYGLPSRREVIRLLGAVAASGAVANATGCGSALTGPGLQSGSGGGGGLSADSALTSNPQPVPSGTIVSCTASVTSTVNGSVEQGYCGLSYEKDSMYKRTLSSSNTDLVALCDLLSPYSVLRVGGNSADLCIWTPSGPGQQTHKIAPSDLTALSGFLNATGWHCIYGINLRQGIDGQTAQTTALAVAEVTAVYNALGSKLRQIEIGNEPDLYTHSDGSAFTWTQYKGYWETYASAINSALPSVELSGPTLGVDTNIQGWTQYFAPDEKSKNVTLLTQHAYWGDAADAGSNDTKLLTADTYFNSQIAVLNGYSQTNGISWKMSECGTYFDSAASPNHAKDFATAFWLIDFLFSNIENGGLAINLHGGTSFKFAPINDNDAWTVTSVNALYYGALLFCLGGYGNAVHSTISASVASSCHSIQVDTKHYSTFILNKDQTSPTAKNMKVVITLPSTVSSATLKVLTASSMGATTGMTLQGGTVGVNGSFSPSADYTLTVSGSTVTCYVPGNSMVLVKSVLA